MNKMVKVAAIIGMVSVMGVGSAWAGRIGDRLKRQENRIRQGVYSGELTRGETRVLVREQRRIRHFRSHAWADGWVAPRERIRLEHLQDNASHRIYRFKHNNRYRW